MKPTKSLTIYDIKRMSEQTSPYFFSRQTLKFFGQKMSDFSVKMHDSGRYYISAPMYCNGRKVGITERFFDPLTNELQKV